MCVCTAAMKAGGNETTHALLAAAKRSDGRGFYV